MTPCKGQQHSTHPSSKTRARPRRGPRCSPRELSSPECSVEAQRKCVWEETGPHPAWWVLKNCKLLSWKNELELSASELPISLLFNRKYPFSSLTGEVPGHGLKNKLILAMSARWLGRLW